MVVSINEHHYHTIKETSSTINSCIQIIRINLSSWLNQTIRYTKKLLTPIENGITVITANMIKPIDVILQISRKNEVSVMPYRLIVNRSDILRIEK